MKPDSLREHAAELSLRASLIGNAFRQFGAALANGSWEFEVENDEIIGRVMIPEVQDMRPVILPLAYLDKETLIRLLRKLERASLEMGALPDLTRGTE